MPEEHFVEIPAGVADAKYFKVGMIDYVIVGLEDGSLHLYNLTKNFGTSYSMTNSLRSVDSAYDNFIESNYEHNDSIVSIEISP